MNDVDAIRLRLEQARESLKEAKTLKDSGLYRGTVTVPITPCSIQ